MSFSFPPPVSSVNQTIISTTSHIDQFFGLSKGLSNNEITPAKPKLEKLFENGFTIDLENCVAGMGQSWPRLNKDFVSVPGISICKYGAWGFGMMTLSKYLDQLIALSSHSLKTESIAQPILTALPTASSYASTTKSAPKVDSEGMMSGADFAASFMQRMAAQGMKVNYSGPALLPENTPLAPEGDQAAALARFQPGDMYYEDSEGRIAIVKGSGPDKNKIIAIDPGMKRYAPVPGISGQYDHGYLDGQRRFSDEPVDAEKVITLDDKSIRQMATKLMAIPLEK